MQSGAEETGGRVGEDGGLTRLCQITAATSKTEVRAHNADYV